MATTPTSTPIFTGTSTYSSDFQQIITRAVGIASLPLTQLNNEKTDLTNQTSELSTIGTKFTALQTAINDLNSAAGASSYVANASDPTIAKPNVGSTQFTGDVSLEVDSLGARTSTLSLDTLPKVSDPFSNNISTATNFTLTVDGTTYSLVPATGSLSDLAQAINSSGAGLQASIINLGTSTAPDYRLSLQGTNLGDQAIQLNDGSQDLLTTLTHGSPATYRINGQPTTTPISSNSRTITISPGLTADLLATGTTDISVSRTTAAVSTALSSLVSAYNDAIAELDTNYGGAGGALSGQSLVYTLSQALRSITSFSGSGNVASIADLGLGFDKTGNLTFDSTAFANASQNVDSVLNFLGATGQSGFLQSAGNILDSVNTGDTSILSTAVQNLNTEITNTNSQIDATQARIDLMQQNLTAQISAADAAIAVLQQQATFFTGLFNAYNQSQSSNKG